MAGVLNPSGKIIGSGSQVLRSACDFRLTLESNVPVSTSNQTAKTSLIMTPYIGKQIALYYNNSWIMCETEEISYSLNGLTANANYDVFAYWNGSSVALNLTNWASDSARGVELTRKDGVQVLTGFTNYKYIGTIRITASTGQCEDSSTNRFVWNYYNRIKRWNFTTNTTNSWTYTSAAWREFNNGTGQLRFKLVTGDYQVIGGKLGTELSGGAGYAGLGIDTTGGGSLGSYYQGSNYIYYGPNLGGSETICAPGYHYVTLNEYCTTATMTIYGYGSTTAIGYGGQVDWST